MKTKLHWLFALCMLFGVGSISAQQNEDNSRGGSLNYVGQAASMHVVPSLASRAMLNPAVPLTEEPRDGRYSQVRKSKVDVVPGKDPQKEDDFYTRHPGKLDKSIRMTRAQIDEFVVNNTVGSPSDPALAVGPNHVVIVFNTGFIIYDKDGNDLTGPLNVTNIFSGGGCCDLTVSYDNLADRWVLTYLFVGAGMELAVSDGPDPTTANWFVYSFPSINDYNKLSVWRDGYYITDNGPSDVWAIDRTAALAGNPAANIQGFAVGGINSPNNGFTSAQVLNITDDTHPTTGGAPLVYMRDDGFIGVTEDEIWIWTINVDFITPANSSVSAPEEFAAAPFINVFDGGGFSNLAQPGGGSDIDALQSTIMNQAQFRKFPTYNSAIFNFVVDTDATAGELAGIRWYEFRQATDGGPWSMFQEGTFNAPDGRHAWNGSMAMDNQGNIGLGYNSMAGPTTPDPTNNRVGAYWTGRFAADAPGVMSIAETKYGSAGNIAGIRFGDYAKMDVDPSNDNEFWFITEYQNTNHTVVFKIAPDTTNDVGVVSIDTPVDGGLSNSETVTVTVFNYGMNAASGFDVTYQVDGGTLVTEAFVGTLASQTSTQHTFAATADLSTEGQTYTIQACTDLTGDEEPNNDCTSADVKFIAANDVGVTAFTSPSSGQGLANETVTVTIENFGTLDQTGFDVSYTVNGGTPVVETVGVNVPAGGSVPFTFAATADLTGVGTYTFVSTTLLGTDSDNGNDSTTTDVINLACTSEPSGDTPQAVGPNNGDTTISTITFPDNFVVEDVNVSLDISHTWSGDLGITLTAPDGTTTVELVPAGTCGNCDDMNITLDDQAATPIGSATDPITGTFSPSGSLADFNSLTSAGDWTLTIVDNANQDGGTLNSWSIELCGDTSLSTGEVLVDDGFEVIYEENNQFLVKLQTSTIQDRLALNVINTLGQNLMYKTLENETGNGYEYRIDMSYVAAGVYFIKLGDGEKSNVKRIIVK